MMKTNTAATPKYDLNHLTAEQLELRIGRVVDFINFRDERFPVTVLKAKGQRAYVRFDANYSTWLIVESLFVTL